MDRKLKSMNDDAGIRAGASSAFGREAALRFAERAAKVVPATINTPFFNNGYI